MLSRATTTTQHERAREARGRLTAAVQYVILSRPERLIHLEAWELDGPEVFADLEAAALFALHRSSVDADGRSREFVIAAVSYECSVLRGGIYAGNPYEGQRAEALAEREN